MRNRATVPARQVRSWIWAAFVLLAGPVVAQGAKAAEFNRGGDASLNCAMTMRGEIMPGDAERFLAALRRYVLPNDDAYTYALPQRICLDSRGGSLAEAVKMVDVLLARGELGADERTRLTSIGTAIPGGARCESACAVLFLAGGQQTESVGGRVPDRVLHVRGRLGFHAPALTVQDGNYNRETVERAFNIAVMSLQLVSERQVEISFPATLFARMVSTPPESMFHITRLGEAAQWMIDIAGLPLPTGIGVGHFINACLAARPGLLPEIQYYQTWATGHDRLHDPAFNARLREPARLGAFLADASTSGWRNIAKLEHMPPSGDSKGSYRFESEAEDDVSEDSLLCEAFLTVQAAGTEFSASGKPLSITIRSGTSMETGSAFLYPPELELAAQALY